MQNGPPDASSARRGGYRTGRYGSPQRYLMKALREVAGELEGIVSGFRDEDLAWRPAAGEWCATEIVGFLRDSEREDLSAVRAIIAQDGARIEERRAQYGPAEHDYRTARVQDLFWDFASLRDEMVWALREAGSAWEHAGRHPYGGSVPLERFVHEISERDLEAMWNLRRICDHAEERAAGS